MAILHIAFCFGPDWRGRPYNMHKCIAILRIAYCILVSGQAERKATACGIACVVVVRTIHDYTAKSAGFANIITDILAEYSPTGSTLATP